MMHGLQNIKNSFWQRVYLIALFSVFILGAYYFFYDDVSFAHANYTTGSCNVPGHVASHFHTTTWNPSSVTTCTTSSLCSPGKYCDTRNYACTTTELWSSRCTGGSYQPYSVETTVSASCISSSGSKGCGGSAGGSACPGGCGGGGGGGGGGGTPGTPIAPSKTPRPDLIFINKSTYYIPPGAPGTPVNFTVDIYNTSFSSFSYSPGPTTKNFKVAFNSNNASMTCSTAETDYYTVTSILESETALNNIDFTFQRPSTLGTYSITVMVDSDCVQDENSDTNNTYTFTYSVVPFDFSISTGNRSVTQGQSVTNAITANFVSGTTQPVSFSVSGLPSGVTASFDPQACTPSPTCNATMALATSASTPPGTYTITVTGTVGIASRTTTFLLTVYPAFDFSLSNGGSRSVSQGQSVTNTVTGTLVSGTSQPVSFAMPAKDAGLIVAWPGTNSSIPAGWSRVPDLDSWFLEATTSASADLNTVYGHLTSTHTSSDHSHPLYYSSGPYTSFPGVGLIGAVSSASGGLVVKDFHKHTFSLTTPPSLGYNNHPATAQLQPALNDPPYTEVIFIQSNGTQDIPPGAWAFYADSDALPLGWGRVNGNRFLKGAVSGGNGGGTGGSSNAHTHTDSGHKHAEGYHRHEVGILSATDFTLATSDSGTPKDIATRTHGHGVSMGYEQAIESSNQALPPANADGRPPWYKVNTIQNNTGGGNTPIGTIAMWRGSVASIPAGWELCNGSGGCPNFVSGSQQAFLLGANANGENRTAGGARTHSHGLGAGHTHSVLSHTHDNVVLNAPSAGTRSTCPTCSNKYASMTHTHPPPFGSPPLSITHSGTTDSVGISANAQSGTQNDNRPEFKGIYYIRKAASVSGLPAGASASFSPPSCSPNSTCSSTITITTLSSTPVGTYTMTVSGTAGGTIRTTSFPLTVGSAFNFSLATGGNKSVTQGQSVTNAITATLSSGTTQSTLFSASGLPSGATPSFSPTSCSPTCPSTLTITTSASTPPGSYAITVTGTAGSVVRTAPVFTLTVDPAVITGTLTVNPLSDSSPLDAVLTAQITSGYVPPATVNFSFWWNCANPTTSVSVANADPSCGSLLAPSPGSCTINSNGAKCDGINWSSRTVSHTYTNTTQVPVTVVPKVIIQHGSANDIEDHETVTVNPALSPVSCTPPSINATRRASRTFTASGGSGNYTWSINPSANCTETNGNTNPTYTVYCTTDGNREIRADDDDPNTPGDTCLLKVGTPGFGEF